MVEGTLCRVVSWYDNEWGFANRMLDTAAWMGKLKLILEYSCEVIYLKKDNF